jgi:hypothetical protein
LKKRRGWRGCDLPAPIRLCPAVPRGSLVSMTRPCGKSGCHCTKGEKHTSLYLAIRMGERALRTSAWTTGSDCSRRLNWR